MPFRQAHFIVGKCVAKAENLGVDLSELNLTQLREIEPKFGAGAIEALRLENSKQARKSAGGTSDESVQAQLDLLNDFLSNLPEFSVLGENFLD